MKVVLVACHCSGMIHVVARSHLRREVTLRRSGPFRSFTLSRQDRQRGRFHGENRACTYYIRRVSNWPLACAREYSGRKACKMLYLINLFPFLLYLLPPSKLAPVCAVVYLRYALNSTGIHSQQRQLCSRTYVNATLNCCISLMRLNWAVKK